MLLFISYPELKGITLPGIISAVRAVAVATLKVLPRAREEKPVLQSGTIKAVGEGQYLWMAKEPKDCRSALHNQEEGRKMGKGRRAAPKHRLCLPVSPTLLTKYLAICDVTEIYFPTHLFDPQSGKCLLE